MTFGPSMLQGLLFSALELLITPPTFIGMWWTVCALPGFTFLVFHSVTDAEPRVYEGPTGGDRREGLPGSATHRPPFFPSVSACWPRVRGLGASFSCLFNRLRGR